MILIFDDTFLERKNDYDLDFFDEELYKSKIEIINDVIITEVGSIVQKFNEYDAIACHNSLKIRNKSNSDYLSKEDNIKYFKIIESEILKSKVKYISFSGSITETQIISENRISISKGNFYLNLKAFFNDKDLDLKSLLFGKNYQALEIQNVKNNILYIIKSLSEIDFNDKNLIQNLILFNNLSKICDTTEWIELIKNNYNYNFKLEELLNKITNSFIKYGKCIYSIR